jgi:hypothetical protein
MLLHDLDLSEPQLAILLLLVIEPIPLAEVGTPEVASDDVALLERLGFMVSDAHTFTLTERGLDYLRFLVGSRDKPLGVKFRPPHQH